MLFEIICSVLHSSFELLDFCFPASLNPRQIMWGPYEPNRISKYTNVAIF